MDAPLSADEPFATIGTPGGITGSATGGCEGNVRGAGGSAPCPAPDPHGGGGGNSRRGADCSAGPSADDPGGIAPGDAAGPDDHGVVSEGFAAGQEGVTPAWFGADHGARESEEFGPGHEGAGHGCADGSACTDEVGGCPGHCRAVGGSVCHGGSVGFCTGHGCEGVVPDGHEGDVGGTGPVGSCPGGSGHGCAVGGSVGAGIGHGSDGVGIDGHGAPGDVGGTGSVGGRFGGSGSVGGTG